MKIEFFTEKEVAEMFRISRGILRRRRLLGLAPGYIRIGRNIRYPRRVLIEFADSITHKPTNMVLGRMELPALASGYQPEVNAGSALPQQLNQKP